VRIAIWENLPPGGAKRAAFELGRGLAAAHDVDLYRLTTTSTRAFDLQPFARRVYSYRYAPLFGLVNRRLAEGRLAPRLLTVFGALAHRHQQIAADIRRRQYDVVLAHTDGMTQSPYLLRWLAPVRSVYFCQEVFRVAYEPGMRDQWRRMRARGSLLRPLAQAEDRLVLGRLIAADRENVAAAGTLVVNSRFMGEQARGAYGKAAVVCYLGIDPETFRLAADGSRANEVLSIGSPFAVKGHDLVLDALGRIPAASRPALRVIGQSARGAGELTARAKSLGVPLTIETQLDEPTLVARYQHALLTICAARREPFGLTAIESMACGTPVVALDDGGYRETVVAGETGLLVEPTADAMAEGVAALVGDPARRARMGVAARGLMERCWTWSESVRRLETILRQAAA
jgi:glycosyltransferase involved in cell wall biosynthesis